jgi:hypothetical protein
MIGDAQGDVDLTNGKRTLPTAIASENLLGAWLK